LGKNSTYLGHLFKLNYTRFLLRLSVLIVYQKFTALRPAVLLLLGTALLLAIPLWATWGATFSGDDAEVIQVASRVSVLSVYFDPNQYMWLSAAHYTPTVISIYQALLSLFGLEPIAFHLALYGLSVCVIWMLAMIAYERTDDWVAGWLVIVMALGLASYWTLLCRFYTLHYWLGAVCVTCVIRRVHKPGSIDAVNAFFIAFTLLLAYLSKEVCLMITPLLLYWAWARKQPVLAVAALLPAIIYLLLRQHVLELSLRSLSLGRQARPMHLELLQVTAQQWKEFFSWYASGHAALWIMAVLSAWHAPRTFFKGLPWVLLFLLPLVGASHGFFAPQWNADRLFLVFHLALLALVAICLLSEPMSARWRSQAMAAAFATSLLSMVFQLTGSSALAFAQQLPELPITRKLLAISAQAPQSTILLPPDYGLGGLMHAGNGWKTTVNCQHALSLMAHGVQVLAVDENARLINRQQVQARCQGFQPEPTLKVLQAPRFEGNVVSWHIQAAPQMQAGLELPERSTLVPIQQYKSLVIRPYPQEAYRYYVRQGQQWWFSPVHYLD
jgi:hypothetical protein